MYQDELKIPKERTAVLIGKKGSTKRYIEKFTNTKLIIDSEGDVIIQGEDSLDVYTTKNIIKAIGRGFNPKIALNLLEDDFCLEIIEIKEFSGKSDKKLRRLRSRVIGTKGKCRDNIERLTDTNISIYGKTISIIGSLENAAIAKEALERLLYGSEHGNVYKWLENKRAILKKE